MELKIYMVLWIFILGFNQMINQVDNTPPIARQLLFTKPVLQRFMGIELLLIALTIITGFFVVEWYIVIISVFIAWLLVVINFPVIIFFRNNPAQLMILSILGYIIFYILLLTL